MENNAYFEQVKGFFAQKSSNELAEGIARAQLIVSKIEDDPVWRNLMTDIKLRIQHVDGCWQDIYKPDVLEQSRVLKKAFQIVSELPDRYRQDLEYMKRELEARDTEKNIARDYDNDTKEE
jgi:hypothetical protein